VKVTFVSKDLACLGFGAGMARIRKEYLAEWDRVMWEASEAVGKLKPGEKLTLETKPLVITLEGGSDDAEPNSQPVIQTPISE